MPKKTSKKRARTDVDEEVAPFINSLWSMVNNSKNHAHIHWANKGKSVKVEKPHLFAEKVVPLYFKHKNIPSFVRQLNLYGFKKTRQDPNLLEFQHEFFRKGKPDDLKKCTRKRKPDKKQKQKGTSSSSSSSLSSGKGATPSDFAAQREDLDKLIKDMAAVHQHQSILSNKVAQLQQQNAELTQQNQHLEAQAVDSAQSQKQNKRKLEQTFHFMVQLYEQFKSEQGKLGNANNNIRRLPFADMQRRSVVHAIEDHRDLDRTTPQDASSATSSRLASAMRESGHHSVTTPRSMSRSNSEVHPLRRSNSDDIGSNPPLRPLRRLTSRDASFFSNPGTSLASAYEDMEGSLDTLGLLSVEANGNSSSSSSSGSSGLSLNLNSSSSSGSTMAAPRALTHATRQQSFITHSPLGGIGGPNQIYESTGEEMTEMQQRQDGLGLRLNTLQRGLSDVLGSESFQQLINTTPLFTDPSEDVGLNL